MRCNTQRDGYLKFDKVAELYDRIRPGYPAELYREILDYARLAPDAVALEIGCGTGQATEIFARHGLKILAVDPGQNLIDVARSKLAAYPSIEFVCTTFEDAQLQAHRFGLCYSATAFHWVPAPIAYTKTHQSLGDGGTIALFWNLMPVPGDAVIKALSEILDRHQPGLAKSTFSNRVPTQIQEGLDELKGSGLFEDVQQRVYNWNLILSANEYLQLLETFANFQQLAVPVREAIFKDVEQFVTTHLNGSISLAYITVLNLGRAIDHAR